VDGDVLPFEGGGLVGVSGHHLAGYKMPRVLKFVAKVPRAPNGKADYVAARALMASADR